MSEEEPNFYEQSEAEPNSYEQEEQSSCEQNRTEENPYEQNNAGQNYEKEPYQPVSQAFGITSMVLGILSLVLFCTCINIPLAVAAIIFGIIQLTKKGTSKAMPIVGIITSAVSIVLFVASFLVLILSTDFSKDIQDGLQEYQYNYDYQFPENFFSNKDDADGQTTF